MKNILRKNASFLLPIGFLVLSSCSSQPTFKPEVGGEGGMSSQGSVVYSIPPQNPVLKMKFASMVIPKKTLVHVRMYFVRKGSPAGEYLDPKEQSIVLPDSTTPIFPTRVHADSGGKPLVRLADGPKQAVELEFPVPEGGKHEYPFILLNWKIHYRHDGHDKVMAETERFDFVRKYEPSEGVGQYDGDLEFPSALDYSMPLPAEWMGPGWIWW